MRLIPQRLAGRGEAGAHRDAGRTQCERRGQATAIGDAAGGDDRDRRDGVDHGRNEAHGAARRAGMAAGVAALRDDDVGARGGGFLGLRQRLHLADDLAAGVLDPAGERRGIAERQHHRRRSGVERHVERRGVLLQRPDDEADADARIAGLGQFLADGVGVGIAGADQAEPAGIGDGGGEPCRRRPSPSAPAGSDARCRAGASARFR